MTSWVMVLILTFSLVIVVIDPSAKAATSGTTKFYLHQENSDTNETYNAMSLTPPEPKNYNGIGSNIGFVQSKSAAAATVNYTSAPTQNNLLVAYVSNSASTAITMTSTGWTAATSCGTGSGGNARAGRLFYKIAGVGESSTVTAAIGATISVAEYSGIDTTTPLAGTAAGTGENSQANASGTNTTNSITPPIGRKVLVVAGLSVRVSAVTYSSQSITGTNAYTTNARENPKGTNSSAAFFDSVIGVSTDAHQGSGTPSTNGVGCGNIAIFKAANAVSSANVGATPPTTFCEASNLTSDNTNAVTADAGTVANRCAATFISQPLVGSAGGTIALNTGDTASITGSLYSVESNTSVTLALNAYIYRWSGSGTTVNSSDRLATITCADPTTSTAQCAPAAVSPANNVTFNAGDRLVVIISLNVTAAVSGEMVSTFFDNASVTPAYVKFSYTTYGYNSSNTPSLAGTLDDDFTTDTATTNCTSGGVTYHTKWTCIAGGAGGSFALLNAAATGGTINGDSSGWLWLQNQTTSALSATSDFGSSPSNAFIYQTLPGDYSNGNITTVINSTASFDSYNNTANAVSPYNHSGVVLWASNTDFLEVQVYSDGAINDTGTNKIHVGLNNSGTLSGAQNLNSSTTGNSFSNVWVRIVNTGGSYQAQYSTDGTSFTNVGSAVVHNAFKRVGLDAFQSSIDSTAITLNYYGAFEWFSSTLASATYNQDAYIWDTNADSTTPGAHLAANNTTYTLTSAGLAFRLRLLLGITGQSSASNSPPAFKLQYVDEGSGTCAAPSGGTPSAYTDVTTSTLVAYKNNPTPADEANISTTASDDPTPSAGSKVAETYQEANNFSASQTDLNNTDRGMWDFALFDNGAAAGSTYCFKVVDSTGTDVNTYTNYPSITMFTPTGPTTDQILRGGEWFNGGSKQPFFWAQ